MLSCLTEAEDTFMASITVTLPDQITDWVDAQVTRGAYADPSDYVRDLIQRGQARREVELTPDALRLRLAESRAGGLSSRTVDDIFAEALSLASARGPVDE